MENLFDNKPANMEQKILGIHHITAIAGPAQRNYDFYAKILGLRFVKKTVNFDDPGTYHFYYGNENGYTRNHPHIFPMALCQKRNDGTGMVTEIGYSVPAGSLDFWINRFKENKVKHDQPVERFGETMLPFQDPDGLKLKLIVPRKEDNRKPWETNDIKSGCSNKRISQYYFNAEKCETNCRSAY